MINKSFSRVTSLFFVLAMITTTCGWLPFQSDFTIHSVPEGAAVYKVGVDQPPGTTPYKGHIFHFDHHYEVRLEGFFDEKLLIDYNTVEDVYVKMRALPVMVYTKPGSEIYAASAVEPLGTTPLEVAVYHEDRTYTLKSKDYYDLDITIGLATQSPLALELERRPIITLTAADGVEIYENDELFATTTMTEEILTDRTFELRKKGFYSKTIELTSTSPYEMDVELVPLPIITIKTTPADATVYLVGKKEPLGKGALILTIEQATRFEVKADRYYTETFTVEPKTQMAEVNLDAMPYVTITSDPAGADILLDGKLLGTTPLEQLIEKETSYEIRMEGYQLQTVTLNGKDAQPVIALETVAVIEEIEAGVEAPGVEVVEDDTGLNLPLIGGIIAAIIAAILIIVLKKKKTA